MKKMLFGLIALSIASLLYAAVIPRLMVSDVNPSDGDTITLAAIYPSSIRSNVPPAMKANSPFANFPSNPILTLICYDTNGFPTYQRFTLRGTDRERKVPGGYTSFRDVTVISSNGPPVLCDCILSHLAIGSQVEQFTDWGIRIPVNP